MEVVGCQGGDYERTMSATREELRNLIFPKYFSIVLKAQGLQVERKNQYKIDPKRDSNIDSLWEPIFHGLRAILRRS